MGFYSVVTYLDRDSRNRVLTLPSSLY